MDIKRQLIKGNGFNLPSIILTPSTLQGAVVLIHGYGGSKEEQLGLGYRIAEKGFKTCVIDLRGHGEHPLSLDENVTLDVETAIEYCRPFGEVAAIGHSLGGRLALTSSADYSIGISPALNTTYSLQTQNTLKNLRDYRVRESFSGVLFELVKKLPEFDSNDDMKKSIIYGSRDIPEIIDFCNSLSRKNTSVIKIDNVLHNDIFTLESTFQIIANQLEKYFSPVNQHD